MARERKVYPTNRIAHLWAHQTQAEARNQQRNLFFIGPVLYSYRESYPIGNIVTVGKRIAVLLQQNRYSTTTARHCSDARDATSHMIRFTVPCVVPSWGNADVNHTANLKWYAKQVADKVGTAQRSRQNAAWVCTIAKEQYDESVAYAKFFKQHKPKSPIADWQAFTAECTARANRAKQLAQDPSLDPKRAAARAKRNAARDAKREAWLSEQTAKIATSVEQWRNGEINALPYLDYPPDGLWSRRESWSMRRPQVPTMLRIKGDNVETSRGAVFPVAHAKRGLALVRAIMASGKDWHANGHTCHLGHYAISTITSDGTVTAGCHVVTWPEIERIAPMLDTSA